MRMRNKRILTIQILLLFILIVSSVSANPAIFVPYGAGTAIAPGNVGSCNVANTTWANQYNGTILYLSNMTFSVDVYHGYCDNATSIFHTEGLSYSLPNNGNMQLNFTPKAAGQIGIYGARSYRDTAPNLGSEEYRFWIISPLSGPPVSDFTYTSNANVAQFNDTSTNNPTGWAWNFSDGYTTTVQNPYHVFPAFGQYNVSLTASNQYGTGTTKYRLVNISSGIITGISSFLDVRDAATGIYIGNVTVGIRNLTDMSWRNTTSSTGAVIFNSTGSSYQYPLSVGQTIGYGASALGYVESSTNDTLMYNNWLTTLFLTRIDQQVSNGTWSIIITVKRNLDAAPISGATVTVTSGVSGVGMWQQSTDMNGIASFINITPSTLALVEASKPGYQSNSLVVQVFPNTTQHKTIELVGVGQTPVVTPVATANTTPVSTVYPVLTDANGVPITSPEGKGFAAFGILIDSAYLIMQIAVGCVIIWLMWMVVYLMTGGKIIDKIMRRGRH